MEEVGNVVSYVEEATDVDIETNSSEKASHKAVLPESSIQDLAALPKIKNGKTLRSLSRENEAGLDSGHWRCRDEGRDTVLDERAR